MLMKIPQACRIVMFQGNKIWNRKKKVTGNFKSEIIGEVLKSMGTY